MKKILLFGTIVLLLAACGKDKFQTVPQVEITSFGPDEVVKGQLIRLLANVTDQEGDVRDSVVFCRKIYSTTTGNLLTTDSMKKSLQELGIPSKQSYEIQLTMIYGESRPEIGEIVNNSSGLDRHFTVGLYVKDNGGNRSTYVESKKIVLKKI